jgi:hypothetical protein
MAVIREPKETITAHVHDIGRGESGFALITVLLVLIGVTALATAGFVLSDSDYRASQNHRSSVHSFLSANGGLYEYVGSLKVATDTMDYSYTTGDATVQGEQLLDLGDGRTLHRITSESSYDAPEGGTARKTVSTVVLHSDGEIEFPAAILSLTTIHKDGGSGDVSGGDHASDGECAGAVADSVAGVAVPPSGYDQNGGTSVPVGDPDILDPPLADLISLLNLDWDAIVNGDVLSPDYTIPPDSWPSIGPDEWPVILVEGDLAVSPGNSGQGALIVEGSLTMNGSFAWDGIILVGENFVSNGANQVEGAMMAGLDVLLGETPPDSDLANGTKDFLYDSCKVLWASQAAFGGLYEFPGSWTESM